jgi:flavin-dependent dehydrogenase
MSKEEVAIVGAGLAGCSAALELKKRGVDAELFEAKKEGEFVRKKQLTGTSYVLSTVPKLIKPMHHMDGITLETENKCSAYEGNVGEIYEVCSPEGAEQMLRNTLTEKGAKINYETRITSREQLEGYKHIIIADGYGSALAKMYDMRDEEPYLISCGLESITRGEFEAGKVKMILDSKAAPGGYIYHLPWNEEKAFIVAFGMQPQVDERAARENFRKYLDKRGWEVEDEWTEYEHFYHHPCYQKDNVYLAGAAGSFTCEFMGFGVYYSVETGLLCAQAITTGQNYEELLWKSVLKQLNVYKEIAPLMRNAGPKTHEYMVKFMGNFLAKYLVSNGKNVFKIINPLYPYAMAVGKAVSTVHKILLKGK